MVLGWLGQSVRSHSSFVLLLASLGVGVVRDATLPGTWRRTVRGEFRRALQLLVLPRACALAAACFTLGVLFVIAALLSGFIVGSLAGAVHIPIESFLDRVLLAMHAADFAIFPAKMISIGLLVALTACLTGLTALAQDETARLLPRGFVRAVVAILLVSIVFSLAV